MKKITILMMSVFGLCFNIFAQETTNKTLPSVEVKSIDGKILNTKDFNNDDKPFVICFFATWCKPCLLELTTINENYEDWQDESGIKIYAVSIDDSRTSKKVKPLINSKGFEYEVILDENSDLKRALSVNMPPHTFIVSSKGEILWQHIGYAPGDELEMYAKYREITAENK